MIFINLHSTNVEMFIYSFGLLDNNWEKYGKSLKSRC